MRFDAFEVSLHLVSTLRGPLDRLRSRDRNLADQARRAATSVPLNLSEGRRRVGKDRLHLFRVAAGSAAEVRTCLLVASAWGYLEPDTLSEALELCDRILAMTWRLTH
jgi:four helix bundle protein